MADKKKKTNAASDGKLNQQQTANPAAKQNEGKTATKPAAAKQAKAGGKAKKSRTYSKGLTDISGRDGFYRNSVDVGRWSYAIDIIKNNFGKLIGLNFLMLVFFAPVVYFLFVRYSQQFTLARLAPFTANLGVGYMPYTNLVAQEEFITYSINFDFFKWLPLIAVWLSVGMSGGMYIMRNICWGEDVSLFRDFFLGIKRNFFYVLIATVAFTLVFSSAWIGVSYLDYIGALAGGKVWYQVVIKIVIIIGVVFVSVLYLTLLSMIVTFKGSFFNLLRNSLLVSGVLLPINVFFAVLAILPFGLLLIGSMFFMLGVMAVSLICFSFFMLVWTVYSQWIYDKFINGYVKERYKPSEKEVEAKKAREEAKAAAEDDSFGYETVGQEAGTYAAGAKPITDASSAVTELPEVFTLDDIRKLKESKEQMKKDSDEYYLDPKAYKEAHKDEYYESEQSEADVLAQMGGASDENADGGADGGDENK